MTNPPSSAPSWRERPEIMLMLMAIAVPLGLSTYMAVMGQIAAYTGKPVTREQVLAADFEFEPNVADVTLDMAPSTLPDETGNYPLPLPGMTKLL